MCVYIYIWFIDIELLRLGLSWSSMVKLTHPSFRPWGHEACRSQQAIASPDGTWHHVTQRMETHHRYFS